MLESELQSLCNAYLKKMGIRFYHPEKGRGVNKTHRAGQPDITALENGKVIFIELKNENGIMSPEQVDFQDLAEENNFPHFIVKSFENFVKIIREWRSGRPRQKTSLLQENHLRA